MKLKEFKELALKNTEKLSNSGNWRILVLHFFNVFLEKKKNMDENEEISKTELARLVNEFVLFKNYPNDVKKSVRFAFKKLFEE